MLFLENKKSAKLRPSSAFGKKKSTCSMPSFIKNGIIDTVLSFFLKSLGWMSILIKTVMSLSIFIKTTIVLSFFFDMRLEQLLFYK